MPPYTDALSELVPVIKHHVLHLIEDSVETCQRNFEADDYNDNYVFGTQLWRNLLNRLRQAARDPTFPLRYSGNGNDVGFRFKNLIVRHHRIDATTKLPTGAKAAKNAADLGQMTLFPDYQIPTDSEDLIEESSTVGSVVLAIEADAINGIQQIAVGILEAIPGKPQNYRWGEWMIVENYELLHSSETQPAEPLAEPLIELRKPPIEAEANTALHVVHAPIKKAANEGNNA